METGAESVVTLQQCLFGYNDGHRLLASSISLNEELATQLLLLTDLAPGLSPATIQGYWTGTPLPTMKSYALIRTWTAPEMPRPGCVWSHVLLVDFADIPRLTNLQCLARCAVRPKMETGFNSYASSLDCRISPLNIDPDIDLENALLVLRNVYSAQPGVEISAPAEGLDQTIFAIWSQQWPKLRRSFSFRTASSPFDRSPHLRFYLRVFVGIPTNTADVTPSLSEPWEFSALQDLRSEQPTLFRKFIWRYGADLRRGLEKFRFLGNFFAATRTDVLTGDQLSDAISMIQDALPSPDDGVLLKADLFSWVPNGYSLVPRADPVSTFTYFLSHAIESFPLQPENLIDAVMSVSPSNSDHILAIAETAAASTAGSTLVNALLDRLSSIAEPSTFLKETRAFPRVRRRVLDRRSELMDSDELVNVDPLELIGLLTLLPADGELVHRVVSRLLVLDDWNIARDLFMRRPNVLLRSITKRVQDMSDSRSTALATVWIQGLNDRAEEFLAGEFLNMLTTTAALAQMAEILGFDRAVVLRAGPGPWNKALESARDNLAGDRRQLFFAFLMSLALYKPTPGTELIFERAFEPLHSTLSTSTLPRRAFNMLAAYLPDVWWWQQWDNCLRLRVGVIDAYQKAGLDRSSLKRLTPDRKLVKQLESMLKGSYDAEFMD